MFCLFLPSEYRENKQLFILHYWKEGLQSSPRKLKRPGFFNLLYVKNCFVNVVLWYFKSFALSFLPHINFTLESIITE